MPKIKNAASQVLSGRGVSAGIDPAGDWRERFDDAVDLTIALGLVIRALPRMILDDEEMTALTALALLAAKELRAIRRDFDGGVS